MPRPAHIAAAVSVLASTLTASHTACAQSAGTSPVQVWEAIGDNEFEKGLAVSPLWPEIVQRGGGFEKTNTDTVYFDLQGVRPTWQLSQWSSRYDLAGTEPVIAADGSVTYANEGKRVARYRDGSLLLDITTSAEYSRPRRDGEPWPHLLIEQTFPRRPDIGKAKRLDFSLSVKLVKCENMMRPGEFDESLHTAQAPFYFVLRNKNEQSEDYGLAIWFGIPGFDYRYAEMKSEPVISWDIGTSMYIYGSAQIPVWGDIEFQDMEWHKAEADILPVIRQALADMQARDLFRDTALSDLELTGMNFGWEIPGTFDAALLVNGISLKVTE